jgi:N-acetylglutamate synthase-like GNAT family acetyltransferase
MKIRKATKKDLNRITELFRKEYAKSPYNEKWKEKDAKDKVKRDFKRDLTFVVEENGSVEGFVMITEYSGWDGKQGFIDNIIVNSKFQGKGFGKALIKKVEDHFKKKGMKKLYLMSIKSSKAFGFYKKRGFKEEDFVSMKKRLK